MNEIPLDPFNKGDRFDSTYYTNVLNNKGIFTSDATLLTSPVGAAIVRAEAAGRREPFFTDFAAAMEKLINIETLQAPQGQIRQFCRFTN